MHYLPKKIESAWQKVWLQHRVYDPDLGRAKRPFYNLTMFPYPSAEGLHVGNMYDIVGCDIFGRLKRMQGHDVFQPIGLDGFGIHSENYALKIGKHPMLLSKVTEKRFYEQIQCIGAGFAWQNRLETYDPEYYRWTQWIFIQMFKRGLAYRKKSAVNWCPSCLTVLADEQVIAGNCERCGARVGKRELEQWFFRITEYAERLLHNLEHIDWSENVKTAQKNWIGRSEGAVIKFPISNSQFSIDVFTTRADTLFGATFIVLAPEHPLAGIIVTKDRKDAVNGYIQEALRRGEAERADVKRTKTGVFTGSYAVNPANNETIPIWIADYVLGGVGSGAIMAVPANDERDFEFAKKFNLPIREVISVDGDPQGSLQSAYVAEGRLLNSGWANGMRSQDARRVIAESVNAKFMVRYRLRDWLVSRQRYWGPPIPMIFCDACAKSGKGARKDLPGWYTVSEKDLPVSLPFVKEFRPTGKNESPLAAVEKFYRVSCPNCGKEARRETDVSDTFLDSSWYYYRYIDTKNKRRPFDKSKAGKWLPVDRYMGGFEHAVLHLLYTRFITMVFRDWGLIDFDEPFQIFRAHGHITKDGGKMSKSKGNVVNPDEYIRAYGADALRMYLMFLGPFEQGGDFSDSGIKGITRFLERTWKFVSGSLSSKIPNSLNGRAQWAMAKLQIPNKTKSSNPKGNLGKTIHKTIKKVTADIENLQYNTAISSLMILLSRLEEDRETVEQGDIAVFLKLLAPFAPHITEELYQQLMGSQRLEVRSQKQTKGAKPRIQGPSSKIKSIHRELWPVYDPKLIQEESFLLVAQVNGKVRATIVARVGITEEEARQSALQNEVIKKYVAGVPKKIVFVRDRLINFVI